MQKITSFSAKPSITEMGNKERGIPLVAVSVFSIFGMLAFFMKAVGDAGSQQLVPFICSLVLGVICLILALACWNKFSKREKQHIDDAVKDLREHVSAKCKDAGVDDEDVREWITQEIWACYCGSLLERNFSAYIDEGEDGKDGENVSGYVLAVTRSGKTAGAVLYRA